MESFPVGGGGGGGGDDVGGGGGGGDDVGAVRFPFVILSLPPFVPLPLPTFVHPTARHVVDSFGRPQRKCDVRLLLSIWKV